jgi:carbon monoxide dehydrogenase subunit G
VLAATTLRKEYMMAVTMSGEFVLPADKTTVWVRLNDAETLKASIPGCESLKKLSDTELQAAVKVKIGPVSARFKGKVNLTDIDAPNSYRISGQGDGGIAGFAKGGANVRLADEAGGGTRLSYDVDAQVGGKIAQLGGRLIDSTAKKLADEFFANFAKALGGAAV